MTIGMVLLVTVCLRMQGLDSVPHKVLCSPTFLRTNATLRSKCMHLRTDLCCNCLDTWAHFSLNHGNFME